MEPRSTHRLSIALAVMLAAGLPTSCAHAQELPKRTVTLEDCDKPLVAPSVDPGKCPVAPGDLNPDSLKLDFGPDKPMPPPPSGEPAAAPVDDELTKALAADQAKAPATGEAGTSSSGILGGSGMFGDFAKTMPRLSVIGLAAGAAYSRPVRPQLGSVNAEADGFNLQAVELAFESTVDPYLRAAVYLHANEEGIEVEEAYASTLAMPLNLELKAGKYKTSFGRINETHSHVWHMVDAPVVVARFLGSEGLRPLGLQVSWLAPLPFYLKAVGNVHNAQTVAELGPVAGGPVAPGATAADLAREAATAATFGRDGRGDLLYVGRLETFVPFGDEWSAMLGGSGAFGPSGEGAGQKAELWGGDFLLRYKPISGESYFEIKWQTEAMLRRRQVPGNLLDDWGLYSELALRLAERWYTAIRGDFADGEALVSDMTTLAGKNRREVKGAVSVAFAPSEFSVVRLQYSLDNPGWLAETPVHAVFLQLGFSLGPHGAHPF